MVPVLVLFWESCGLSVLDIYLLQAAFALSSAALEVPTGMVADRLGRRASLLSGQLIVGLGFLFYAASGGFWSFLVAEVIIALGAALLSGADAALLYDSLAALGREEEYTEQEGRARAVRLLSFALCNLLGGALAVWSLRATLWASAVGPLLALGVVASFADINPPRRKGSAREELSAYRALLGGALRFVRKHRLVRWHLSLYAVLMGSASWLLWMYQPYMSLTGLPLWSFGVAFALYNLFAAGCSRLAGRFEQRLGPRGALVALGALHLLPLLLMATVVGPLSFLFVLGHQAVRGLFRPIITGQVLRHTYDDKRATVLSLATLGGRLFFALTAPVVGFFGDRLALTDAILLQGALLAGIFAFLAWRYVSIPEKYLRPSQ